MMKHVRTASCGDDQAQFQVDIRAPEGTSAEDRLVADALQQIRQLPGVLHSVTTVAGVTPKCKTCHRLWR